MRSLVTGCAGFVGSHLTESLLQDGHEVVGVDCFNNNYARQDKLTNLQHFFDWDGFTFVPIDLSRGELRELTTDVDIVFHLAAEPGVRSSWGSRFERYVQNNVVATQHLLEALADGSTKRLVYASSSSIYGDAETLPTKESVTPRPESPYGMTKLAGEHLCGVYRANHGVRATVLRYFTVYGPRQRPDMAFNLFIRQALRKEPIRVFGDGRQTRDFTFVSDITAATRSAAASDVSVGRTYNVGGGARTSLRETLAVLGELAGRRLDVTYGEREPGDVRDTAADTSRAREDLGYVPQIDLREGLQREFDWLAQRV